ncbi:MAG: Ig-like domain-containing protein [Gemmatimonadaceae bacterium]
MSRTTMKRYGMRKPLLTGFALAVTLVVAIACGELTGPESPTTPSDVVATLASPTSVTVTWTPSPLNDGVISYSVYRNGDTKVGETVGTEARYTDTGLSPQTTYVYSVAANCASGVVSNRSVETEASTVTTVDVTPPTVVLTIPVPGATQVSPVANINVDFSEPMNPASINASTLQARVTNGAAIAGTVTYNAATRRATLTPTSPLPNFSSITATITTGATDLAGNALRQATTWTFTTRDDIPPTVIAASPANGATGVSPNAVVTVTFSERMNAATVNPSTISLRITSSGTAITSIVTYNADTRVATLTPSGPLSQNVNYTLTVSTGVRDEQGNAMAAPYSLSFTVGDTTPPTVVSTVPADGATGVATNTIVSATFSEPMDSSTINTTTFTLRLTSGGGNLAGSVAWNAGTHTATFTPSAVLAQGVSYTATVTTGARDVAGNPMTAAKVWTFVTIDNTPPTVTGVVPANNATAVPTSSTVRVTFSEPMDPATITTSTITVRNTVTTVVVAGTMSYDQATRTAAFTPGGLSNLTNYTVTVTTGVRDLAGNALAAPFTSTFTTAPAADVIPPTIVSRSPANGVTSIAIDTVVRVTFSEPMDPATINTSTITLTPTSGGSPVAATVTYVPSTNTAVLDPTPLLAYNTSYTITVTTGVKDVAGNSLAAQSTSTFTTTPDTVAPTVTARRPTALTGVADTVNVTVTFSESMDAATINGTTFTLTRTTGVGSPASVAGAVSYSDANFTATLNPSANLTAGATYTATVTTGAKDKAGNALTGNFSFSFTVAP